MLVCNLFVLVLTNFLIFLFETSADVDLAGPTDEERAASFDVVVVFYRFVDFLYLATLRGRVFVCCGLSYYVYG